MSFRIRQLTSPQTPCRAGLCSSIKTWNWRTPLVRTGHAHKKNCRRIPTTIFDILCFFCQASPEDMDRLKSPLWVTKVLLVISCVRATKCLLLCNAIMNPCGCDLCFGQAVDHSIKLWLAGPANELWEELGSVEFAKAEAEGVATKPLGWPRRGDPANRRHDYLF